MNKTYFWFSLLIFSISFSCCKPDPEPTNEEEVITTLVYTLTSDSGEEKIFSFQDPDGDGGEDPLIISDTLSANQIYTGRLTLLNESVEPIVNITEEIEAENNDHQFFFQTTVSGLTIAYADQDGDNKPVGLETTLTTGDPGDGTLLLTLRHEPNKSAEGVSSGDITNAGGETDIEITFTVDVQ